MSAGTEPGGHWPTTRHATSFGFGVPVAESKPGAGGPRFADQLAVAETAAGVGIDALWFADHFSFQGDDGLRGSWDAWTLMAAIAARVPDVQIGPMVACTGYRNPGVIAKMTEMIDEVSGGRFILGLGAGWNKPEYDQFGIPMEPRVSRFEEAIQIIHGLLRNGEADLQGRFYQANQAKNLPRGPRPQGAPILVGSSGDRMLGLLARYADAWDTGWDGDTEGLKAKAAKLEAACATERRDPATVVRSVSVSVAADGLEGDPKKVLHGSVEEQVTVLRELEGLGFGHIRLGVQPFSLGAIESLQPLIEAFHTGSKA
jgi:alkanesulfonate monooxygenase SsuD/methylene tetrahydromethanopterin reductase-like flavin-dependent oxidoreductase (luciferase family)